MVYSLRHLRVRLSAVFLAFVLPASLAQAQAAAPVDSAATEKYIHASWDELSRSVADCHSLADSKVTTRPIVYLPADISAPPAIQQLSKDCAVEIRTLPHRIEKIGDLIPSDLAAIGKAPGLLYLPNKYVVPGGRFNEMYGWDSYFILLGLIADQRIDLARGIVENFWFEIEHYGGVLNANRTYYLTRSQPPFLTSMIRAVYEAPSSFPDATARRAWLERGYTAAQKDYETWLRPEHRAGTTGLARYFDYGVGPVPEMADDSTYYPDVIRWLIAHPQQSTGFLIKGSAQPDAAEAARLKTTSCDVTISEVCLHAEAGGYTGFSVPTSAESQRSSGFSSKNSHTTLMPETATVTEKPVYRLSKDFFLGDRAMRESGFDPSFRFGAFSGATHHYAPVCLNSLLFRYERDMAHFAHLLGKVQDAHLWEQRAKHRAAAMNRYLWQPKAGVFADYDFTRGRASNYAYISSLYPLWAGIATREQATQIEASLKTFERPGGLSQSDTNTGMQWDEPYGWAPCNWIAISGLSAYQFRDDVQRLATAFRNSVDRGFATDGTIREKYNVVSANANVQVTTGYKTNVIGFGWTNAVYLKLGELLK